MEFHVVNSVFCVVCFMGRSNKQVKEEIALFERTNDVNDVYLTRKSWSMCEWKIYYMMVH